MTRRAPPLGTTLERRVCVVCGDIFAVPNVRNGHAGAAGQAVTMPSRRRTCTEDCAHELTGINNPHRLP